MSPPLYNQTKTSRKKAGLSQDDVAFLLGKESGSYVSRVEQNKITPDLFTALSYQILFDIQVHQMFAGIYTEIQPILITRIAKLTNILEKKGGSLKIRKRIVILNEVARTIANDNSKSI